MVKYNLICVCGDVILEAYCTLRQLERGIDAAMSESWSDFQAYYVSKDKTRVERFVKQLEAICSQPERPISFVQKTLKNGFLRHVLSHSYHQYLIDKTLLFAIKRFLKDFHNTLDTCLVLKQQRDLKEEASEFRDAIECNYRGIKGLKEANSVNHYFQNPNILSYSFEEILNIYNRKVGKNSARQNSD